MAPLGSFGRLPKHATKELEIISILFLVCGAIVICLVVCSHISVPRMCCRRRRRVRAPAGRQWLKGAAGMISSFKAYVQRCLGRSEPEQQRIVNAGDHGWGTIAPQPQNIGPAHVRPHNGDGTSLGQQIEASRSLNFNRTTNMPIEGPMMMRGSIYHLKTSASNTNLIRLPADINTPLEDIPQEGSDLDFLRLALLRYAQELR